MALDTVSDYVNRARVLLLDEVVPFRYPDNDLVNSLSEAFLEIRRLRPDIVLPYFRADLPDFRVTNMDEEVPMDPQYRVALVYYICGQAQLRDEENTQDSRASAFLQKFGTVLNAAIM
jgi:hypothetical protein